MKTLTIIAAAALAAGVAAPATAAPAGAAVAPQDGPRVGAAVRGTGGVELGRLQGQRTAADGRTELIVRGADGTLRAIPRAVVMTHGDELHVDWTAARFGEAAEVEMAGHVAGSAANQGPTAAGGVDGQVPYDRRTDRAAQAAAAVNRNPTPDNQQAPDPTSQPQ